MSKLIFIILFVFSFLFIANFTFAADPPPCECTGGDCCDGCNFLSSDNPCSAWTETECHWGTGCGQDVGERTVIQYCNGKNAGCDGAIERDDWSPSEDCQLWEACSPSTASCSCSGTCLGTPNTPLPADDSKNIKLPLTLSWNTVNGATSYRYKIDGVLENSTISNSVPIDTEGTCLLKSNTDYTWTVQACCNSEGNNCGSRSNWSLKTASAPQSLTPKNGSANIAMPVTLDWCDVADAQFYILRTYIDGLCHPLFLNEENGTCEFLPVPEEQREGELKPVLHSDFNDTINIFTKNNRYEWEIASCFGEDASSCEDYGVKWVFFTGEGSLLGAPELKDPFYNQADPDNIPIINQLDSLSWQGGSETLSYRVIIEKDGRIVATPKTNSETLSFKKIPELWDNPEDFNAVYSWRVKPCWDRDGNNCEAAESAVWQFKTTGAKPNLTSPINNTDAKIPIDLKWEDIPEAVSYYYEIATDDKFTAIRKNGTTSSALATINYPDINLDTKYWWRVKTCADAEGRACGVWNDGTYGFKTFPLNPPTNPQPANDFLPVALTWTPDPGANFYQYKVAYAQKSPEETFPGCIKKEGQQIIPATGGEPPITNQASFLLNEFCLGSYQWRVRSCLNKDCSVATSWADWGFNSLKPVVSGEKGIVPCSRKSDNTDTLYYDEREPCQIKHFGFMLQNIIDFLLWRLGLIIIAILAVFSGVVSYFSLGSSNTLAQIKSIWKSAGIGWGIMLLAWIFINLIMALTAFQIEFFGRWWQLPF